MSLFKSKHYGGFGFRSIRSFDEALLAKQVWRLHKSPNSLLAQCLKARYYPHNDVLKADLGHNPSYAWRSIHYSLWVIIKGGCWKIGDGNMVNVWEDSWLPFQNGYKILSQQNRGTNIHQVSELISEQERTWNHNIIESNFYDFESNLIKQLPLIKENIQDAYMWMYAIDGNYTVKSGYNAIRNWKAGEQDSSSCFENIARFWKKVWNLQTIPRHKDFIWRVMNDSIPVKSELSHRGLSNDIICPRCYMKIETLNHTFIECPYAKKIWFGSDLNIKFSDQYPWGFKDWFYYMVDSNDPETIIKIASIAYNIWYSRNMKQFQNKDIQEEDIIAMASKVIHDFKQCNQINNSQANMQTTRTNQSNNNQAQKQWSKPPNGMIKINTDACLTREGTWGLSAVCRDSNGEALAAATWRMCGGADPIAAESFVVYLAIDLAKDCCFQNVIIESDNQNNIRTLQNIREIPNLYVGNVLLGIKQRCNSFRYISFQHVNRSGNLAAHILAQFALDNPNKIWIEENPICIDAQVRKDQFH